MANYKSFIKFFGGLSAENTRKFEVDVTHFAANHSDAESLDFMHRIVEKESDAIAYAAFYCLTVVFRNQKDYEQLHKLLDQYEGRFSFHVSYKHVRSIFLLESDAMYDYDVLLDDAYTSSKFLSENAGYVHNFAYAFAVICEKQGYGACQNTVEKWYDKALEAANHAIALDGSYAKYYCTKARILAVGGHFSDALNLIKHAISIERSTRSDYAIRIADYQYHSLFIQIQQMGKLLAENAAVMGVQTASAPQPVADQCSADAPNISEGIGKENFVFISYSHKDSPEVWDIIRRLQHAGVKVWYDKGLPVGPSYFDQLADKIDTCKAVFLLLSNSSVNSQYVRKELCYALSQNKNVIHANIDGVVIPRGVQIQIGDLQGDSIANYNYDKERFYTHLIAEIAREVAQK